MNFYKKDKSGISAGHKLSECTKVIVDCNDGCGNAICISQEDFIKDYKEVYISLVSSLFYSRQKESFSRKCKRIWDIIRNKEYTYFDICISYDQLREYIDNLNDFYEKECK